MTQSAPKICISVHWWNLHHHIFGTVVSPWELEHWARLSLNCVMQWACMENIPITAWGQQQQPGCMSKIWMSNRSEVTGHKSVAVRKYKHTSMEKQRQMSNILYSKNKKKVSSTVSKAPDSNFELGVNSQMDPVNMEKKEKPIINMNVPKVQINSPVINVEAPKLTVNPVINLHSQDLIQRSDRHIEVPEISVNLTININWTCWLNDLTLHSLNLWKTSLQFHTDSPYWTIISTTLWLNDWKSSEHS